MRRTKEKTAFAISEVVMISAKQQGRSRTSEGDSKRPEQMSTTRCEDWKVANMKTDNTSTGMIVRYRAYFVHHR